MVRRHTLTFSLCAATLAACGTDSSRGSGPPDTGAAVTDPNNRDPAQVSVVCTQSGVVNADPNRVYDIELRAVPNYLNRSYLELTVTEPYPDPPVTPLPALTAYLETNVPGTDPAVITLTFQGLDFTAKLGHDSVGYSLRVRIDTPGSVLWPVVGGAPKCTEE